MTVLIRISLSMVYWLRILPQKSNSHEALNAPWYAVVERDSLLWSKGTVLADFSDAPWAAAEPVPLITGISAAVPTPTCAAADSILAIDSARS